MAIYVSKNLKQLEDEANNLGIVVVGSGKEGKKKKEDYIKPLREFYLKERYGSLDKIPEHMKLMLNIKSPMLSGRIDKFKKEQQEEVWNSEEWDFEPKLNGIRCLLVYDGGSFNIYSRFNSDDDLLPINLTPKILLKNKDFSFLSKSFIIDCEITSNELSLCNILNTYNIYISGQTLALDTLLSLDTVKAIKIQEDNPSNIVFNCFDCLYYGGRWVIDESLIDRRKLLSEVVKVLIKCGISVREVEHTNQNKKEFFRGLVYRGFEGCIAKRLHSIYIPDTSRNFKGWIKCKRESNKNFSDLKFDNDTYYTAGDIDLDFNEDDVLNEFSFGDTSDVFISGFEPGSRGGVFEGLVESVLVSAYIIEHDGSMKEKEVGKLSGLSLNEYKRMTEVVNNEPVLKPEYYGRVCEVDTSYDANKNTLNCSFVRWRWDKTKESCMIEKDSLVFR